MTLVAERPRTAHDLIAEGGQIKKKATFTRFDESTVEDWAAIEKHGVHEPSRVLELCLEHLDMLRAPDHVYPVDRYEHSLQTASRAWRDGRDDDDELIAAALLHDIGDFFAPDNHGEFCAAILKPYVRPEVYWIVKYHEMFQGYHFFHHLGGDRNARDSLRGHPHFEACRQFCDDYDQIAFDPTYDTMPLEAFMPTLHRVFEKPRRLLMARVQDD